MSEVIKRNTKKIGDYKLFDELYRHVEGGGTFRFLVDGIRTFVDGVQLEVECQTCSHGWKCRLLLAENDYGRIVSVHMLNEDEGDIQRHWHSNEGLHFWPTHMQARDEALAMYISRADERIKELEVRLKTERNRRDEWAAAVGGIEPKP